MPGTTRVEIRTLKVGRYVAVDESVDLRPQLLHPVADRVVDFIHVALHLQTKY